MKKMRMKKTELCLLPVTDYSVILILLTITLSLLALLTISRWCLKFIEHNESSNPKYRTASNS